MDVQGWQDPTRCCRGTTSVERVETGRGAVTQHPTVVCRLRGPLAVLTLIVAIGGSPPAAWAQGRTSAPKAPVREALKPGEVDVGQSRVYVLVGKTGLGHDHGIEGRLSRGELRMGAGKQAGRLEFDLRTFQADTPAARRYVGLAGQTDRKTADKVTANMVGPDVLDVGRFPTAVFDVHSVVEIPQRGNQPRQYQVTGDFTLHGVKRQVQFPAQVEVVEQFLHVRGAFAIRQTDYQITPYTAALGAVGVADALTIHGDLWLGGDANPSPPARSDVQSANGGRSTRE